MLQYNSENCVKVKSNARINNTDLIMRKQVNPKRGFYASKFVELCKRTDLHGFKYIVMEELNLLERSCWASAVLISIACAAYLVVTAYRWYARNPIVTVIESTQGAIWDVPFPAVTICDLNTVSRRAARAFADDLTITANVTADFIYDTFRLVPLLHSTYTVDAEQKQKLYKLQAVLDLNNISIEFLFRKLSPSETCNQLVQRCMWKNTIYRCDQLFQQIFTVINLCCTFNYYAIDSNDKSNIHFLVRPTAGHRPSRTMSMEDQSLHTHAVQLQVDVLHMTLNSLTCRFPQDIFHHCYEQTVIKDGVRGNGQFRLEMPRRVASCGYQTALTVLLNTNPDDYYSASVASQGALVFIDNAYNVPDLDSSVRMVNPSTEVLIALSPERTYTTSGIKAFGPEQRQCYYNDEVKIGEFRQYSFHNCMAYRKVEIIRNVCDCVPFYFPIKGNHRICNFNDMDCLENVFNPVNQNEDYVSTDEQFKCLPECEHYDYPIEVALGKLAKNVHLNGLPFFNDVNLENRSLLNVFFNDLVSTKYRRDVYLNWQNILASFGGLLSLMLGFTLISGFDLILFFILRLAYDTIILVFANKEHIGNKIHIQSYHKKEAWLEKAEPIEQRKNGKVKY